MYTLYINDRPTEVASAASPGPRRPSRDGETMTVRSHLRALLRGLKAALRHWRLLRELDAAIEEREDAIRDLDALIAGARRRLERAAGAVAFRKLVAGEVASVHGIGPTLAARIAEHPLTGDPGGFRASVERVKGVGEMKKERLLEWERGVRERHGALRDRILEEGGVDPELEATLARLRADRERERAALADLVERRRRAEARGPDGEGGSARRPGPEEPEAPPPARVVLDTNVFVGAGFNPDSASAELVGAVREGALRMPWTRATRAEVERILTKIPPLSWHDVRELFREEDRIDGALSRDDLGWIPDPDDRIFAAVARSAGAVLVSSDAHLLAGRSRATFAILTPGEYREWRRE